MILTYMNMILTYKEALKKYETKYTLNQELEHNKLFKIEKGIYSTNQYFNELERVMKKNPNVVFTYQSAFYYWGLTDTVPNAYHVAINRTMRNVKSSNTVQTREVSKFFTLGITTKNIHGVQINVYNQERMLIELVRKRNSFKFEYYKEIINNYREKVDELDMDKLTNYLSVFEKGDYILEVLIREVF